MSQKLSARAKSRLKDSLSTRLKSTTRELANLNRELAGKMVLLASQTGDTGPLISAVEALRKAEDYYSTDNAPRETAEIRQALADTLYMLGKKNDDVQALEHAIEAYRGAITLASLLGDHDMRASLKKNYALAKNVLGSKRSSAVATRAA